MKIFGLIFVAITVAGCAPEVKRISGARTHGTIYFKMNLNRLAKCSETESCASGESCINYDDSKNAYCYPEGRENEVVGCSAGALYILIESTPARVACI